MNQDITERIEQVWQRAIERALEDDTRAQELGETLNDSAGLAIQSGVKAGRGWGNESALCTDRCTRIC